MIGVIITAKMMPRGEEAAALRAAEEVAEKRDAADDVVDVLVEALHLLREHEHAPEPEHHRGDDGEKVHEIDDRAGGRGGAPPG